MSLKRFSSSITQGFFFHKVIPGILIGIFAANLDPEIGSDVFTFALSMVVFWGAIGVGHGLAELTAKSES